MMYRNPKFENQCLEQEEADLKWLRLHFYQQFRNKENRKYLSEAIEITLNTIKGLKDAIGKFENKSRTVART